MCPIVLGNAELSEEATLASFRVNIVNIKGDNAYPTGGTPGISAVLPVGKLIALIPLSHAGYIWDYDPGTDKLKMYQQSAATGALTEVTNGTNLRALTFRALALGQAQ